MHPNRSFRWDDDDAMLALVRDVAFTRIYAATPVGPRVAHAPVLVTPAGMLRFHLANNNVVGQHIDGASVLTLTDGPNAYVSANWYADMAGSVPTWNYVSVECEGTVRALPRADLIALLDDLSIHLEPMVGEDWTRAKMDPARFEAMLGAITAYELSITAMRGTRKLSQNKSAGDVTRVTQGMIDNGADAMARQIAAMRP